MMELHFNEEKVPSCGLSWAWDFLKSKDYVLPWEKAGRTEKAVALWSPGLSLWDPCQWQIFLQVVPSPIHLSQIHTRPPPSSTHPQ